MEICRILFENGLDSIEVSGNGTSVTGIKAHHNEAYFLESASELAEKISIPVILVGGLRSLDVMQKIINSSKIELLSLLRPLICQPDFPNLLRDEKISESKCISCNSCYSSEAHRCIFN